MDCDLAVTAVENRDVGRIPVLGHVQPLVDLAPVMTPGIGMRHS